MEKNRFVIDFDQLELTSEERNTIAAALQTATVKELSKLGTKDKVVFLPIRDWPRGPIINGMFVRGLKDSDVLHFNHADIKGLKDIE